MPRHPTVLASFLALCLFSTWPSSLNADTRSVSRETFLFLQELAKLPRGSRQERTRLASGPNSRWFFTPETGNRAARALIYSMNGGPAAMPSGVLASDLVALQLELFNAKPSSISILERILDRYPDYFIWDNSFYKYTDSPIRARLLKKIETAISTVPQNPYLLLARAHLAGEITRLPLRMSSPEPSLRSLDCLSIQGEILYRAGRPVKAAVCWQKALNGFLELKDDWGAAEEFIHLAQYHQSRGETAAAEDCLRRASAAVTACPLAHLCERLEFTRGYLHLNQGRIEQAVESFLRVWGPTAGAPTNKVQASSLINLGYACDERGDYEMALLCYSNVITFYRQSRNFDSVAVALLDRGVVEEKLNMYESAMNHYQELLGMTSLSPDDPVRAVAMGNIGNIYSRTDEWEQAISCYTPALAISSANGQEEDAALIASNLALCLINSNRLEEAEKFLQRARSLQPASASPLMGPVLRGVHAQLLVARGNVPAALKEYDASLNFLHSGGYRSLDWEFIHLRGKALEAIGCFDDALACYEGALAAFETLERQCRNQYVEIHFLGSANDILESILRCSIAASKAGPVPGARGDRLFELLENYRARILARRLVSRNAPGSVPAVRPSLSQVQHYLQTRHGCALIYFEGRSHLYGLWLDGRGAALELLGKKKDFYSRLHDFEYILKENQLDRHPQAIRALADFVLPGRVRALAFTFQEHYILPDGGVFLAPMELVFDSARHRQDKSVGIRPPVFYLPSWQQLFWSRRQTGAPGHHSAAFLGVYCPVPDRPDTQALTWAESEVRHSASSFRWDSIRLVSGDRAAGDGLRKWIGADRWNVIHLAAHIQPDEQNPWNSLLVLGGSREKPFTLTYRMVEAEKWDVNLIYLSGCSSARGRFFHGEGNLSLATAFLASGCRSVLTALWPLTDRAACRFAEHFYRGLAVHRGEITAALLDARTNMRRSPAFHDPYYWAGYVLYGVPLPIEPEPGAFCSAGTAFVLVQIVLLIVCAIRVIQAGLPRKQP